MSHCTCDKAQPKKTKIVYLSETGKERVGKLLQEYQLADTDIMERFEFRNVRPDETDQVIEMEQVYFPMNEACSPKAMRERVEAAPELFLVAVDRSNGKIAGFMNGLSANEYSSMIALHWQ